MNILTFIESIEVPLPEMTVSGKADFDIFGFAHTKTERSLCTFLENERFLLNLPDSVSVLITKPGLVTQHPCVIQTDKPKQLFYLFVNEWAKVVAREQEKVANVISPHATIEAGAIIAPHNVHIGDNVLVEAGAIIKSNVMIGENSIIRSGCVIGGTGFQFGEQTPSQYTLIEHSGSVLIEPDVEIQQNSAIDRAIFDWDATTIGKGTKIASLVQIAHGCTIGTNNLIASGTNFGGRVCVGEGCWFGLNSVISNGIIIGDFARVNLGAVVTKNVSNNESVSGNFAIEHSKFIQFIKKIGR